MEWGAKSANYETQLPGVGEWKEQQSTTLELWVQPLQEWEQKPICLKKTHRMGVDSKLWVPRALQRSTSAMVW